MSSDWKAKAKPMEPRMLQAMMAYGKRHGSPLSEFELEVLKCPNCWTTPVSKNGTKATRPSQATSRFAATACKEHGGTWD